MCGVVSSKIYADRARRAKGYDVVYLATLGYQTAGLDLSPIALEKAKEYVESTSRGDKPKLTLCRDIPSRWATSSTPAEVQPRVSFQVGDFFKFEVPESLYDVVYDYTLRPSSFGSDLLPKPDILHYQILLRPAA